MGLGAALTGLVFGAVAAVTTQLTAHARGASGLALAVLGAAFLVRGVGDIMRTGGSWLSWFSPLAWAQQTRPFVDLRWWPLALSLGAVLVLLAAAVALAQRRDLGAGLLPGRPGPAGARPTLLSPAGLAARLLRGSFLGWAVGLFVFAVAFGSLARSVEDAVADLPQIGEWIGGGSLLEDMTATFAAAMLAYLTLGVAAFAVGAVLRLRAEEEAGRAGLILAAGASRARWLGGWLATVLVQVLVLLALSGLGLGLGVAAATGDGGAVGRLTAAALAYLPAVLATAGLAVALLGLAPRLAVAGLGGGDVRGLRGLVRPAARDGPLGAGPLTRRADPVRAGRGRRRRAARAARGGAPRCWSRRGSRASGGATWRGEARPTGEAHAAPRARAVTVEVDPLRRQVAVCRRRYPRPGAATAARKPEQHDPSARRDR